MRGELVRYEAATKQFLPFVQGAAATDVAFSRDGKSMVYVSIPDGNLWRSDLDGSNRTQLTYSAKGRRSSDLVARWQPHRLCCG